MNSTNDVRAAHESRRERFRQARARHQHRHQHGPERHRHGGFGPGGFGPGGVGPGEFGPGGFGPGGPFDGPAGFDTRGPNLGGRGPRGRRGHRGRRSRGDIRLAVLALLAERPRHGYEIIQEIAERTSGAWRPSPGSVYPAIAQLEDEGLARTEEAEGRRIVHLTDAGQAHVGEHPDELAKVWEQADQGEVNPTIGALREQYGLLHAAVLQIASAGTDAQRETAATALAQARKTIYRMLAED